LQNEFTYAQSKYDTKKMKQLITEMEALPEFQTGLHKQRLLLDKSILHLHEYPDDYETAKVLIDEAILLSIPTFNPNDILFN